MRKLTHEAWKHIVPGTEVPNGVYAMGYEPSGFRKKFIAPDLGVKYVQLFEYAVGNTHHHYKWEPCNCELCNDKE